MPISAGTRLGPYEILSGIGAGGMGEVYKATDTRLDRTVAIKVLPEHVASDPDLKQRFEREARTVAALNHPHICTLHDIGTHDGIDFLVMEYLDGQTLAQRLEKGALPLDQALTVAIQIADALDRAHRQGIVHRDLKPANIMLTKAGAKLLDFGLAKLKPTDQVGGLSAMATQSAGLTGEGKILGTLQYMAPEQLEGKDVDARTDIFAFGATVYEMVTGQKAFTGESQASLIAAILERVPVPMATLQSVTPARLDEIVKTCLAKDPDERWQSAGDVGRQMRGIADGRSQTSGGVPVTTTPPGASQRQGVPLALAASVIGSIITGLAVWSLMRAAPVQAPLTRFVVTSGISERLWDRSWGSDLALSPDGRRVAYLTVQDTDGELQVRELDQLSPTTLVSGQQAHSPFFSPDGEWMGFFHPNQAELGGLPELAKVSVRGGPLIRICELPSTGEDSSVGALNGASWGADDTIIFATAMTDSGLWRVDANGGEPELLTTPDAEQGELDHRWPALLPDGNSVLFTIMRSGGMEDADIAVLSLADNSWRVVVRGGSHPRYVPTGHLVYAVQGALHAVPFDLSRREVTGEPIPVLSGVTTKPSGAADFALSQNGSLAYLSSDETGGTSRTFVWVDRQGREEPLPFPPGDYRQTDVSPDGTRIATWTDGPENADVWVGDVARGNLTRLTTDPAHDGWPRWTPDGERVVFASNRDGSFGLFWKAADGTGPVEHLMTIEGATFINPQSWSPDGTKLVFFYNDSPATGQDIGVLSVDGEPAWEPLLQGTANESGAGISPDGRWMTYASDETGQYEGYVQRFPELGQRQQVTTGGGNRGRWSRDGREMVYTTADGRLRVLPIELEPTFRAGAEPVVDVGPMRPGVVNGWYNIGLLDAAPDFQRFLLLKRAAPTDSASVELVLIQNWTDELQRLVPVP